MKKIIIAMLILLAIMTLTAVSAGENQTDEVMASPENTTVELESAQPQDVISDTPDTFTDLEDLISSASAGDTITLSKDYEYNEGFSTTGITLNKTLTIEGAGHTIDAQAKSKIFTITAPEVILNNIKFINAGSSGALTVTGDDVVIANSTFTNCYSTGSGGAVHSTADNMLITNSTFTNCTSDANGGAVYIGGDAGRISDSTFSHCTASNGGAVYFNWEEGKSMRVSQSVFSNNAADDLGGAIYNCDFEDCIFESNTEPEIYLDYELRKPLNITADVANILVGEDLTVIINLFPNISAPITVMINGSTVYGSEINGTVIFTVENLTSGEYELSAICNGSIVYAPAFSHVMFTVSKYDPVMNVSASNVVYGEYVSVMINLPSDATGNVSVNVDGTNYTGPVVDGKVTFLIPGLAAGSYVCNVGYGGDRKYNGAMKSTMFTVSKLIPAMNVSANDAYFGEDVSVMIYLPADATGNVSVIVNAMEYNSDVVNGEASLNIHNLETGTYCGIVTYPGDLNYNDAVANITFEVKHNSFSQLQELINDDVTGTLTLDRDYYGEGTEITISKSITIDGNGHTLNANGLSRIFNVQSGSVVISNLVLVNASGEGNGGAVYFNDAGSVSNCEFTGNTAYHGGAVYFLSQGTVTNCNFADNHATSEGGAVWIYSGNVSNCNFTNNTATYEGGAVYFSNNGEVTNCNFIGNTADEGGAIFALNKLVVDDSTFDKNSAEGGAAIFISDKYVSTSLSVNNCNFTENNVSDVGGAILVDATYGNGAVYTINGSTFTENVAINDAEYACVAGGAVYVEGISEGNISNNVFIGNKADSPLLPNGGAIKAQFGAKMSIVECTFEENEAYSGGAIDFQGNTGMNPEATIINCLFRNNKADAGGAIACLQNIGNSQLTVKDSHFITNEATIYGGAIYSDDLSTVNVTSSEFEGNNATNGGAVYFNGAGNVSNCIFTANSAENGGAIYGRGNATDSVFTNNAASNLGGAIYNCNYEDCIFESNTEPEIYFDEELRKEVNLTISAEDISYGEILTVNVVLSGGISANLTATLGDENMNVSVVNGTGILQVAGLNAGEHFLTVTFSGTYEYKSCSVNFTFLVSKRVPAAVIETSDIMVGQDEIVTVTFNENITGMVTVQISPATSEEQSQSGNGTISPGSGPESIMNIIVVIVDGKCNLSVNNLPSGKYTATLYFHGNENYNSTTASSNFTVSRYPVLLNVNVDDINVGENPLVNFIFNETVNGNVTVTVWPVGQDIRTGFSAMAENGTGSFTIPYVFFSTPYLYSSEEFKAGNYSVMVEFKGNEHYNPVNASSNFTVFKLNPIINVIFNNDDKTITLTPPADITGNVELIVGGKSYLAGSTPATFDLSGLASGNYTYTVSYPGDDRYNPYSASANITLTRQEVNVMVGVENITYGDSQNVTATVPEGATGDVEFVLYRNNVSVWNTSSKPQSGVATCMIPDLDAGTYTLKSSYTGDSRYERSELVEKTFRVNPNINIQPRVKIGDDGKIVIEVGKVRGNISVYIDDELDGSKPIKGNNFTYYLATEDYTVGDHNLTFEYSGEDMDENVFKSWDSKTQTYTPTKYLVYISQRQAQAAQNSDMDKVFTLVLEEDGVELTNATGNVTFVILDEYNKEVGRVVVEVVNGIAQLDISRYKNGNYLISWTYSGDEKYEPISRSMKMDIEHKASRIDAGDLKIQYTLSKMYSLTVYGEDSKPLANAKVEILANNKVLANVRTNANGVAAIKISYIPGTYNLVIRTPGKTLTKKLTVTHLLSLKTVKVKRSAKKLVLTATLAKVNGKYLKSKKITFKFNGKKYTAKTNKKGVAKVTIKKKVLKKLKKGKKVKYQATYLKDTVKKTAKVKK